MRKINLSNSYFTLEGEFLDECEIRELESKFGNNEEIIKEIKAIESLSDVEINLEELNGFWDRCAARPDQTYALAIAESNYQTTDANGTFEGLMVICINSWCEITPKKVDPIPEPKTEQLELF